MKSNLPKELFNAAGIYEILNTVNGKRYIGCSSKFRVRRKNHQLMLKNKNHHNRLLMAEYIEYGGDNFEFNIIHILDNFNTMSKSELKIKLHKKEVYYIRMFNALNDAFGYNTAKSKASSLGAKQAVIRNGASAGATKYSTQTVIEIKILIAKGWNNMQIVNHLNIKPYLPTVIRRKRAWGHLEVTQTQIDAYEVDRPDPHLQHPNCKLNSQLVEQIKIEIKKGYKIRTIAKNFGVVEDTISRIKHGKQWAKI